MTGATGGIGGPLVEALASMITWVLAAPPDSYACELAVLPTPR
ncbi:hypothetical protein [Nonomuraea africana]|uniref:Nucleoside-diphosphate-sugar epimerase n=1 Tax=Nonomuraea africana TaxID=46171 RepID=A0ABR9KHG6_9ACTN|nr:hypothetical protein [Nonomuraea africana]MBE1561255.1 nucleoside-diphosphate-sugar epimerase [Nonomuraea africana]